MARTPQIPRARLDALPPDRRAQLLDPAEAAFAEHGLARASLNQILTQAGMSKGQAYHYIADKADLYAVVLERGFARLVLAMDFEFGAADDPQAFWTRVNALVARISEVLHGDARLAALAIGIYESAQTRAAFAKTGAAIRNRFAELITLGQSLGAVRSDLPDDLMMDLFFAMVLEVDRWFAANWTALDAAEMAHLNLAVVAMFRAAAQPAKIELSEKE
ncbi:hypothetical protein U879_03870 [Defluviimonas sp. 20V17]|uniref:Transcriptional regulator, TetR family n=1 Tax=Allgaiera indica TaxID=765699 RepID=A0AAN5A115_9RHOB|nr:TetR/AcrR family transcriptional regulator [Allgaiera indica]KDB04968.1 hypothetical protein U879_03870 [Defluviimonas sp. 20V17]GHE05453.1 hypothetical protein GCM10008024_36260 [Allgaiera indica]SDX71843.1 transcriptional regulator, TetR family [Allgaiera indica]